MKALRNGGVPLNSNTLRNDAVPLNKKTLRPGAERRGVQESPEIEKEKEEGACGELWLVSLGRRCGN